MRYIFLVVVTVVVGVSIVALGYTFFQAQQERAALTADLQYRTGLLAESLRESIEPAFQTGSSARLESLSKTFSNRERLVGFVVFDVRGEVIAGASKDAVFPLEERALIIDSISHNKPQGIFERNGTRSLYVFATPLLKDGVPAGAFLVSQDAGYIDVSVASRWQSNLVGAVLFLLLFALAIGVLVRWVLFQPLWDLTEGIRDARSGRVREVSESKHSVFVRPLATEINKLAQSLSQARAAASEEARMRNEKLDTPWTAERLQEFIKAHAKNRPIFVASHAEPFTHKHVGRNILVSRPAGGVVTAVSSIMEACGGLWLAHGGGDADVETADKEGKLQVPPEEPRYTLKRLRLDDEEMKGYYRGFSNEALWPLCHIAYTRPIFRQEDWTMYRTVNGHFARALLEELKGVERPLVLIQDYHLALLPKMIKEARPDALVAIFWHIPWPSAEQFSVCPWRKEILEGMLGADLVGFHTQLFCNNLIETAAKEIESVIDYEQFTIRHDGHVSHIKPFPISIAFSNGEQREIPTKNDVLLESMGVRTEQLILGVDRLDYTKGIVERIRGIEYLFKLYPQYRERVTFLQIGSPTRTGVEKYRDYRLEVEQEIALVNAQFATSKWQPIVFKYEQYPRERLNTLYRHADVCLVTSLHDGMNLVAKEYVAARDDEAGVLVLSQFTGAARDLKGALMINPYSAEETAGALHQALSMPASEQHRRMKTMRAAVRDYNVYRWAADLLRTLARLA